MAEQEDLRAGTALSRVLPGVRGVEYFRAVAIKHHYGRHSHPGYSIGVIEGGVGGNFCRGATHHIPSGNIVVMNPEEAHTGFNAGDQPLTYRMLYLEPEFVSELFEGSLLPGNRLPYFRDLQLDNSRWSGQLTSLYRFIETSSALVTLETQSRLLTVFSRFFQTFATNQPSAIRLSGHEPDAVTRVKEYLSANYQRNVTIEELARLTGFNRAYLIRAFRQTVGMPPYTFLLQLRVERAKELLAGGLPLAEVALETGFADQSHLTRHFKTLTALTPRQYQVSHYCSRIFPVLS